MSKVLKFTVVEILPALLDKSKTQTIRRAYEMSDDGKLFSYKVKQPIPVLVEKPARFKVGDKATLMWNQRSKSLWFYKHDGSPAITSTAIKYPSDVFPKVLGEVEITDVFKITMIKNEENEYRINQDEDMPMVHYKDKHIIAKRDGFKSADDMFAYFDKAYDLSTPKTFWVYRWRWL